MGCKTSKLDRLPAVSLCRERCKYLDEALCQSYALADTHVAHMESLKTLGPVLLCFCEQFEEKESIKTNSPIIDVGNNVIKERKPHLSKSPSSSSFTSSNSDLHDVVLHSDSESENEDTDNKELKVTAQSRYDYLNHDTSVYSISDHVPSLYDPFSPPSSYGGYSCSKPPSPPPPPNSTAWDFLNFFEPYEKYQLPYVPICDTGTIEEKEKGKVTTNKLQNVASQQGGGVDVSKSDGGGKSNEAGLREKNLVSEACSSSNSVKVKSAKCLYEAVKEIQILLERASNSGNRILELMEVGKLRYHPKIDFNLVSSKIMHVFTPSIPSNRYQGFDKDNDLSCGNLCSTLRRLCMWEKKLYHEVKAEEELRILHQKKCRELRYLKKKDVNAQKVDSVQTSIGILVMKMKISIQVVDKISITISKLREEELWPQINNLILMSLGMWKDMLQCYRSQYQEIAEAKPLDASSFNRSKLGNAHIDAAIRLKSEVQNWNLCFSDWIHAQKSYVKALNCWLVRCLLYEPEEIQENTTPFSPGKIGAPPVFVICNKWSQAMDNISEKNVTEATNGFMLNLNEFLDKHILDLQQRSTLDKELERKMKILERQEQKMQKVVQGRERKMVPIAREETKTLLLQRDGVQHGDLVDTIIISLKSGLEQIFAAMESFTASTARAYEELCQQIKQDDESNKIH